MYIEGLLYTVVYIHVVADPEQVVRTIASYHTPFEVLIFKIFDNNIV